MAKIYTAQDLRDEADFQERCYCRNYIVATMLRQAASDLEREEKREKKYEYAVRWVYDNTVGCNMGERRDWAESIIKDVGDKAKLVRRPVGEWEEVTK